MPARRQHRPYESPLRAEQMDRTREKLIQAGIDIVTEAGSEELTLRHVAARAGVSVPTAYRHFPDPDALFDAIAAWINERISGPDVPKTADGVPAWARHLYAGFEANDRLMRAQLSTPAGRILRAKNQKTRIPRIIEMVRQSFPAAPPATQHRIAALVQLLINVPAWVSLHDNWGMTGAEAGELSAWAIEAVLAEARRRPGSLDFPRPPEPARSRGPGREERRAGR